MKKPTVMPCPLKCVPSIQGHVIETLSRDMQAPIEMVFHSVLAVSSLACLPLIEVIPPYSDKPEPCSLYFLTSGDSGIGKTMIFKKLTTQIYAFEERMAQEYQELLKNYKDDHEVWRSKKKALDSNLKKAIKNNNDGECEEQKIKEHNRNEPKKPVRLSFIYRDISFKALIEALGEYPIAGLLSDEAVNFFGDSLKDMLALLNKAWDGDNYDFRRANGDIYNLKPYLLLFLMCQPDVLKDFLKRKNGKIARSIGSMARFLTVWVESAIGSRDGNTDYSQSNYALDLFNKRINELLEEQKHRFEHGITEKKTLTLQDEATDCWKDKIMEIERKMAPGGEWEHIRDIAAKAGSNVLRIAAIISYFCKSEISSIPENTIKCAFQIIYWYLEQASIFYYPMSEQCQFIEDIRELFRWIRDKFNETGGLPFPKNDLLRTGPNRLRKIERLTPVLDQLINQGLICIIDNYYGKKALHIAYVMENGHVRLPYPGHCHGSINHVQMPNLTLSRSDIDFSDL